MRPAGRSAARAVRCGRSRPVAAGVSLRLSQDDATLDQILPPEVFDGIGVSDDVAVYQGRFVQPQKCWGHPLRKAIKLALWYPRKKKYQRFLDRLLERFHDAGSVWLRMAGWGKRVVSSRAELEGRLGESRQPHDRAPTPDQKPHDRDFSNLVNELIRLLLAEELFTFVLEPEVEPTNNRMERQLRSLAQDRKAGRTSQTAAGAHRRSAIVSVLESLRANLDTFSLASVLAEVGHRMNQGISLFARQWQAMMADKSAEIPNTSQPAQSFLYSDALPSNPPVDITGAVLDCAPENYRGYKGRTVDHRHLHIKQQRPNRRRLDGTECLQQYQGFGQLTLRFTLTAPRRTTCSAAPPPERRTP